MQQTLWTGICAILHHSGMKYGFWAEALAVIVHVMNRAPRKHIDWKTPHEVLTGQVPNVAYFRIFGCHAWVHNNKGKKLDAKGLPMVFVGYEPGSKHIACGTQPTTRSSFRRTSPSTKPFCQTNQPHHWLSLQSLRNDLTPPTRRQRENESRLPPFRFSCSTKTTTTHQSYRGTFHLTSDRFRVLQALPLAYLAGFLPLHLANRPTLLLTLPHPVPTYGRRYSPIRMTKPTKSNN